LTENASGLIWSKHKNTEQLSYEYDAARQLTVQLFFIRPP